MRQLLKNSAIGVKLPVIITALVALTILAMTFASSYLARNIVKQDASVLLNSVASVQARQLKSLLNAIDQDLLARSAAPETEQAIIAFSDAFQTLKTPTETLQRVFIAENENPDGEKDLLVKADTGSNYGFIHSIYHPTLNKLQKEMHYYDLFLFDTQGNLVYSVFKELDFATNMLTGPWKDSGLADAYRAANVAGPLDPATFVDFARYAPSAGAPAAFIARPVFSGTGKRIGVIGYQMPIDEMNLAIGEMSILGQSADGYLVGADALMRTDSQQMEGDDILNRAVENDAIAAGFGGQSGIFSYIDPIGRDVMGYVKPVDFLGTRWVAIVQQNKSELFAAIGTATKQEFGLAVVVFLAALGTAIYVSRGIAAPVQRLTQAVSDIAKGNYDTAVPEAERGDEIGALARATEVFRQNAIGIADLHAKQEEDSRRMAVMAEEREKAAAEEIKRALDREAADKATVAERQEMMRKLGASFGTVVSAAIAGQFSGRVEANFTDATLNELANNINALLKSFDTNLSQTVAIMTRIASGDLSRKLDGNLQGDFAVLQSSVNTMVTSLQTLIGDITENSTTLTASSGELRHTSDVLSRQAEHNAASIEETSAALEELTVSVKQVNATIRDANEGAKQARASAEEGAIISNAVSAAMDRIADGSQEIARVVKVIDDIAFQINLLALNAGVEAARAGESGRGFAVVASEVRSLAQRAAESVNTIASVITQSDAAVSEGVKTVAQAKTSLQNIAKGVIVISQHFEEVANAISEQAVGIQEISTSISTIDGRTQRQAASFEEVSASSMSLASQAEDLTRLTNQFTLQSGTRTHPRQANAQGEPITREAV